VNPNPPRPRRTRVTGTREPSLPQSSSPRPTAGDWPRRRGCRPRPDRYRRRRTALRRDPVASRLRRRMACGAGGGDIDDLCIRRRLRVRSAGRGSAHRALRPASDPGRRNRGGGLRHRDDIARGQPPGRHRPAGGPGPRRRLLRAEPRVRHVADRARLRRTAAGRRRSPRGRAGRAARASGAAGGAGATVPGRRRVPAQQQGASAPGHRGRAGRSARPVPGGPGRRLTTRAGTHSTTEVLASDAEVRTRYQRHFGFAPQVLPTEPPTPLSGGVRVE